MNDPVTARELNERRDRYYMDQQVGAYSIVLSIALGVAGLAAASLFSVAPADRSYRVMFWVLWVLSLAAVAIAYSGVTVNVFALPNRIPDPLDIFSPFIMALLEFTLFAVLTRALTDQISPRSVVALWFGCFATFSCLACLVITRIRWLFVHATYEPALAEPIAEVIRKLHNERRGAATCSVIGIIAAVLSASAHAVPLYVFYIFAGIMAAAFITGFLSHNKQRQALESGLDESRVTRVGRVSGSAAPQPDAQPVRPK
jgi:hypothetical protein